MATLKDAYNVIGITSDTLLPGHRLRCQKALEMLGEPVLCLRRGSSSSLKRCQDESDRFPNGFSHELRHKSLGKIGLVVSPCNNISSLSQQA